MIWRSKLASVIYHVLQIWFLPSARNEQKEERIFLCQISTNIYSLAKGITPFFILECSGHQSIFILSKSILAAEFWSVICKGMSSFGIDLFSHWKSHCCDPSNSSSLYTYLKPILHEKLWCCRAVLTVAGQDINGPCCLSLNHPQNVSWIKWRINIGPENSKQKGQ